MKENQLIAACRCCLATGGTLRNFAATKLPVMIESFTAIKISENDGLPKQVCVPCLQMITRVWNFKKKIERTDKILQNYVKRKESVEFQHFSDILHKAVNDAEIGTSSNDNMEVFIYEDEIIDEDKKPVKTTTQKENDKVSVDGEEHKPNEAANVKIDNLKNCVCADESTVGIKTANLFQPIFVDEPPPLIPIATSVSKPAIKVPQTFPKDAPPLVPIKPLPVPVPTNFTTNTAEKIDVKLQCNDCLKQFSSVVTLKEHKMSSCQSKELQCNICKKEFKDTKRLIGHLKGHMIAKDYRCKICEKCYPNPSTFRVHMRTHTGERPFKCSVCCKGFVRWAGVVGHMKTHTAYKPYQCETCGKGFKVSSNLERHKSVHLGVLPFSCNYCEKTFSQSDNLRLHVRTYHTLEKPYLCSECGKSYVSAARLKRHAWVHSGYKPYRCLYCPKAYTNSNDLKNHELMHNGGTDDTCKPYECEVCKMRFFHLCRLSKHMKSHQKPFMCHECSKCFGTEAMLKKHLSNKHMAVFDTMGIAEEVCIGNN